MKEASSTLVRTVDKLTGRSGNVNRMLVGGPWSTGARNELTGRARLAPNPQTTGRPSQGRLCLPYRSG